MYCSRFDSAGYFNTFMFYRVGRVYIIAIRLRSYSLFLFVRSIMTEKNGRVTSIRVSILARLVYFETELAMLANIWWY